MAIDVFRGMNPNQREAIAHTDGPLLVVAGAGSGKTRVITHRIAHLIQQGTRPDRILAITFTNKAAGEMRERIEKLSGTSGVWVSTFHSLCARMLRMSAEELGLELPPMPKTKPGVAVPANVLATYAGCYQTDGTMEVVFSVQDADTGPVLCVAFGAGQEPMTLVAVSQTEFKASQGFEFTFRLDAAGKPIAVKGGMGSKKFVFERRDGN